MKYISCKFDFSEYCLLKAIKNEKSRISEYNLKNSDVLFYLCVNMFLRLFCTENELAFNQGILKISIIIVKFFVGSYKTVHT